MTVLFVFVLFLCALSTSADQYVARQELLNRYVYNNKRGLPNSIGSLQIGGLEDSYGGAYTLGSQGLVQGLGRESLGGLSLGSIYGYDQTKQLHQEGGHGVQLGSQQGEHGHDKHVALSLVNAYGSGVVPAVGLGDQRLGNVAVIGSQKGQGLVQAAIPGYGVRHQLGNLALSQYRLGQGLGNTRLAGLGAGLGESKLGLPGYGIGHGLIGYGVPLGLGKGLGVGYGAGYGGRLTTGKVPGLGLTGGYGLGLGNPLALGLGGIQPGLQLGLVGGLGNRLKTSKLGKASRGQLLQGHGAIIPGRNVGIGLAGVHGLPLNLPLKDLRQHGLISAQALGKIPVGSQRQKSIIPLPKKSPFGITKSPVSVHPSMTKVNINSKPVKIPGHKSETPRKIVIKIPKI